MIEFGQWSEAFKTLDDIHKLMQLSVKKPKPQLVSSIRTRSLFRFFKKHIFLLYSNQRIAQQLAMFYERLAQGL